MGQMLQTSNILLGTNSDPCPAGQPVRLLKQVAALPVKPDLLFTTDFGHTVASGQWLAYKRFRVQTLAGTKLKGSCKNMNEMFGAM